ncbi:CpsD/CapB family tyrosine-protein kinase [Profundibacter sp.]
MEKIQNAIAKARAERDTAPGSSVNVGRPSVGASTDAANSSQVLEAWDSLPELKVDNRRMEKNRIVSFSGGKAASSIDMMRTRILQQMRVNNWRRLAITSGTADCGKSTISLNLAFSLSQQSDFRTILMEMDLRRPSLAKTLGIKEGHNLAAVLNGSARFEDNALRYGKNLIISTNKGAWKNPAELLQGAQLPKALAEIEATYEPDMVIMDMPPMLVSEDVMAFLGQVDCVLLVAAAEATTIKQVDMCERELAAQTNVMGVVLNKCRYMEAEYGYGYYG